MNHKYIFFIKYLMFFSFIWGKKPFKLDENQGALKNINWKNNETLDFFFNSEDFSGNKYLIKNPRKNPSRRSNIPILRKRPKKIYKPLSNRRFYKNFIKTTKTNFLQGQTIIIIGFILSVITGLIFNKNTKYVAMDKKFLWIKNLNNKWIKTSIDAKIINLDNSTIINNEFFLNDWEFIKNRFLLNESNNDEFKKAYLERQFYFQSKVFNYNPLKGFFSKEKFCNNPQYLKDLSLYNIHNKYNGDFKDIILKKFPEKDYAKASNYYWEQMLPKDYWSSYDQWVKERVSIEPKIIKDENIIKILKFHEFIKDNSKDLNCNNFLKNSYWSVLKDQWNWYRSWKDSDNYYDKQIYYIKLKILQDLRLTIPLIFSMGPESLFYHSQLNQIIIDHKNEIFDGMDTNIKYYNYEFFNKYINLKPIKSIVRDYKYNNLIQGYIALNNKIDYHNILKFVNNNILIKSFDKLMNFFHEKVYKEFLLKFIRDYNLNHQNLDYGLKLLCFNIFDVINSNEKLNSINAIEFILKNIESKNYFSQLNGWMINFINKPTNIYSWSVENLKKDFNSFVTLKPEEANEKLLSCWSQKNIDQELFIKSNYGNYNFQLYYDINLIKKFNIDFLTTIDEDFQENHYQYLMEYFKTHRYLFNRFIKNMSCLHPIYKIIMKDMLQWIYTQQNNHWYENDKFMEFIDILIQMHILMDYCKNSKDDLCKQLSEIIEKNQLLKPLFNQDDLVLKNIKIEYEKMSNTFNNDIKMFLDVLDKILEEYSKNNIQDQANEENLVKNVKILDPVKKQINLIKSLINEKI